ncbi:hypothetical protein [Clostridium butyricum]|nr:hypothetical protein [Clostridium butyricum]
MKINKKIKNRKDDSLYNTKRWKKLRKNILDDYDNICLWSLYVQGKTLEADRVHHIVEVLEDETLVYEYDNCFPLEKYNHYYIHELYKSRYKEQIRELLRKMLRDYNNGDRTLNKYKNDIEIIERKLGK